MRWAHILLVVLEYSFSRVQSTNYIYWSTSRLNISRACSSLQILHPPSNHQFEILLRHFYWLWMDRSSTQACFHTPQWPIHNPALTFWMYGSSNPGLQLSLMLRFLNPTVDPVCREQKSGNEMQTRCPVIWPDNLKSTPGERWWWNNDSCHW